MAAIDVNGKNKTAHMIAVRTLMKLKTPRSELSFGAFMDAESKPKE